MRHRDFRHGAGEDFGGRLGLVICVLIMLLAPALPTMAADEPLERRPDDGEISMAIESALAVDEGVASHRIDVVTTTGVVTLSGSVDNLLAKERATELAAKIKGVRSIVDRIEVRPVPRPDSEIRSQVREALISDPATDSWEIAVEVEDGIVRLTGIVDSWAEKNLSETVAKSVRGVKGVDNDIGLQIDRDRIDSEIEAEIERRLESDIWVDAELVDVQVTDGRVMLSGSVGSVAERGRARMWAWVAGVDAVDDSKLEVDWWARHPTHRESPYEQPDDATIRRAVVDALLYDPRVSSYRPTVDVDAGVVTLTGTVHDFQARRAAEENAENTFGVWRVRNYLKVRPEPMVDDATVASRIEAAFDRNPLVEGDSLTVTVLNGKVQLYGKTSTHFERTMAERIAGNVKGVVAVGNSIEVANEWTSLNDLEIEEDVEEELFWSPFVDSDDLTVDAVDGVVTLSGTVDSERERRAAVENAFEGGAHEVRSRLVVAEREGTSEYFRYPPYAPIPY